MGDFLSNSYDLTMQLQEICIKDSIENPKVSIIVPAYNVEEYIEKCLMSLIKQTLKDIEIIVIDDGSTDNTHSIACVFKEDKRVKVIQQTNQKQGAARNRGLEIAQGEFIGFVDADDWVDLDYFEKMYNAAKKNNANIAAANATRDYKNKVKYHLKLNEEKVFSGTNNILKAIKNNLVVHSKIFRFNLIKDLRFREGVFYEDAPYAIRAIDLCRSLVTVPDTTYHYFSNPKSTIKQGSNDKNKQDKIITNLDLIDYCEDNNIDIGNWEVLKERHFLWGIKHYKNYKDFYIFGFKLFRKNLPFDNSKNKHFK